MTGAEAAQAGLLAGGAGWRAKLCPEFVVLQPDGDYPAEALWRAPKEPLLLLLLLLLYSYKYHSVCWRLYPLPGIILYGCVHSSIQ